MIEDPVDLSRFSLYRQVPVDLSARMYHTSLALRDYMSGANPQTISSLVMVLPQWKRRVRRPENVTLLTFGTFRSHYRAIERVAAALVDFYLSTEILPIVRPVTAVEWRKSVEYQAPLIRTVQNQGLVVYISEPHQG